MKIASKIIAVLPILAFVFAQPQVFAGGREDTETLVQNNTEFAVDLCRELKKNDGNFFFSPYSISTALAMTYAGARGLTEKQMKKTLRFSMEQKRLHPAYRELRTGLNEIRGHGNVELCAANSLWPHKDYKFLDEFMETAQKYYGAGITSADYMNATEEARQMINTWVEKETRGNIRDLLMPNIIDPTTRLVLVNAIYFKGRWAEPFDKSRTEDAPFYKSPGKSVMVPMMTQKKKFMFADLESVKILELPYAGNDISMVVLLPSKADGLSELEDNITVANLAEWTGKMRRMKVSVFLPRFRMTSQFRLDKTLQTMGMPVAFSSVADFSGMDGTKELYISAVIHKAFADVNEEGTEAAASTAVMISKRAIKITPVFRADHPFLFLIRDNETGGILFIGRVADPSVT